jgi:hypothetical protein
MIVSKELSLLNLSKGEITDPEEINIWLSTKESLTWNETLKDYWGEVRISEDFKKWMAL